MGGARGQDLNITLGGHKATHKSHPHLPVAPLPGEQGPHLRPGFQASGRRHLSAFTSRQSPSPSPPPSQSTFAVLRPPGEPSPPDGVQPHLQSWAPDVSPAWEKPVSSPTLLVLKSLSRPCGVLPSFRPLPHHHLPTASSSPAHGKAGPAGTEPSRSGCDGRRRGQGQQPAAGEPLARKGVGRADGAHSRTGSPAPSLPRSARGSRGGYSSR